MCWGGLGYQTFDRVEEIIRTKPSVKYIFIELSELGGEGVALNEEPWQSFTFNGYWRIVSNTPLNMLGDFHDRFAVSFFKPNRSRKRLDFNVDLKTAFSQGELVKRARVSAESLERLRRFNLRVGKDQPLSGDLRGWTRIENLIEIGQSKGVQIWFFVPPRILSEAELKSVSYFYSRLDKKNRFEIEHFDKLFYEPRASIDGGHLNKLGARKFTEKMASEFKRRTD